MNKTLITLETLSQTTEIWGFQDKFSWMIIPRNMSSCTRVIKELFINLTNSSQFFIICFLIDDKMMSQHCQSVVDVWAAGKWIHNKLFNYCKNVYIWRVNPFTSWVKNDEFWLGRMDSEFVSIKSRRNMGELKVAKSLWQRKIFVSSAKRIIDKRFET